MRIYRKKYKPTGQVGYIVNGRTFNQIMGRGGS